MISVEGLKVEFGVKPLFVDASFVVNDRDRIALVGKNGAGKSTMLKILCGQQKPTAGVVSVPTDCHIGYLPQVMILQDDTTVREEAQKAFADITRMKERLDKMNQELAERTDYESESYLALIEKYTLLDEPTNHLDIESIQWLEQFLAQSSSAVVLVSHDRAFINNVSNRTLEISCGRVIDYKVKYDEYVVLRKEHREQQVRAYENQQKEVAEMKAFIERFRYQATKAVQVQQKIKQLEKIVPIEIDEVDNSAMHLKFPPCLRSGDYPIICDDVRKDYGAHTVFDHVSLTIKRGEKVAFVGKNGEGKSTLVKCIMGEIPYTGELKVGHNIQIGYFAQNQAQLLDESLTVFQTIDYVAKGDVRLRINDILGAFMFGGEESDKKVKVLSGGERSRLAMIRLLLEPVNLLILDEPTNHLDMPSKDVLKEAIKAFDGTAIIVSHDREFLDGLVTKVYEFGDGRVREHLGGIYDFLQAKKISELNELGRTNHSSTSETAKMGSQGGNTTFPGREQNVPTVGTKGEPSADSGAALNKALSYAEHKEQQKRVKRAEKAVKESEAKIEKMEARLKELDELLMQPEKASDMMLVTEYTQTKQALDEEVERWEQLSEALEELNQ